MNRTATQAFDAYARPLEAALACVAQPHFASKPIQVDVPRVFTFQQGTVNLKRIGHQTNLHFEFFLGYRIIHERSNRTQGPFWVETESWTYNILNTNRRDLLTYHWTPIDQQHPDPHLHVGSAILNSSGHELGKGFSKLHIATGLVSIQQIVRMLIEEFDVQPVNDNWEAILSTPVENLP